MRTLIATALVLSLAACGGKAKKTPDGPAADDVPQEVTCCISANDEGVENRMVVPTEKCPEEQRNPVDACSIGPGDNEPSM